MFSGLIVRTDEDATQLTATGHVQPVPPADQPVRPAAVELDELVTLLQLLLLV